MKRRLKETLKSVLCGLAIALCIVLVERFRYPSLRELPGWLIVLALSADVIIFAIVYAFVGD